MSMATNASFSMDLGTLGVRATALDAGLDRVVGAYMKSQAPRVQDYARTHAPWTDRTGNARQGLFARYSGGNGNHVITVYHTVSYGIWLEVRFAGRNRIIQPTVTAEGNRVMAGLGGLLAKAI
jgi:hypothetical protein